MAGVGRRGGGRVVPGSRGGLAIGRWRALTALTVVLAGLSALLAIQKRQVRVEAEALRQTVRRQVTFRMWAWWSPRSTASRWRVRG